MKASEVIYSNLSTLFDSKVYPLVRTEGEKGTPYLVYTVLNANATNVIAGYTGREMAYLQLDVYSYSYDECENLTNQVIKTLGVNVQPFHYENRKYLYESDTKLYRQSIECHIWQTS